LIKGTIHHEDIGIANIYASKLLPTISFKKKKKPAGPKKTGRSTYKNSCGL
jgi:hypothetical protein